MRHRDNGYPVKVSDTRFPAQMFILFFLAIVFVTVIVSYNLLSVKKNEPKSYDKIFKDIKKYKTTKTIKNHEVTIKTVTITSYNPLKEQTDSTPFIMASGKRVYHGAIAYNGLPIGTKVWIAGFGRDPFIVEDRTARKYKHRLDIFSFSKKWSMAWGKRKVTVAYLLPKGK